MSTSRFLQSSQSTITRRQFFRYSTIAATAAFATAPAFLRGQGLNNKLNIGVIGADGKGASDTDGLAQIGENIVALCDIDEKRLTSRAARYPKAKLYRDYRKMLEEMKEIDAVTVSTPDHHHAPASMMAIKLKKHVYCQKPLTHSIYEARKLAEAAREYKVATIMGNQGHSGDGIRLFCELIWGGAIGPIREAHAWTDRPIWPQGLARPKGEEAVPAHIDWDLFLGPAPARPYHSGYHPFNWRGWWDFGTGALGDMACHVMDGLFWGLKLGHPEKVGAWSAPVNAETAPKWSIIRYQFPAREAMPPVKVVWYDGGKQPSPELLGLDPGDKMPDNGTLLIGDKGKILTDSYGARARFTDDSKVQEFPSPPKTLPRVKGHYQEFAEACKGGKPAGSNFDYAGPFTEMVLLGNLAVRCGKELEWDGPNMKAKNCPEADRYVRREYRSGWTL